MNTDNEMVLILLPGAEFCNATEMLVTITNELSVDEEGWAQIAPMGDFPGMAFAPDSQGGFKRVKAIQRIDSQAIADMVNEFKSHRVKRYLSGCPIFVGHPDGPLGAKYPDKGPKGVFADLAERNGAFMGMPVFTNEGRELVEKKTYRALSGRWSAEPAGTLADGTPVFRPAKFISAGLTNQPNLPVQLLNEAETENQNHKNNTMKKEVVIALLSGLGISGITISNEASDEQVSEALKQLGAKAKTAETLAGEKTTLANDKATLEQNLQAEKGKVTTLTTEKQTITTERDTARTSFANERQGRITDLLDTALKSGAITAAERATWEGRLKVEASFANEAEALKALKPKVKTQSVTLERGDRKVEISNATERKEMVADLVNEEMNRSKSSYDAAFARVQKNYPQLFQAMESPVIKKGGVKTA